MSATDYIPRHLAMWHDTLTDFINQHTTCGGAA